MEYSDLIQDFLDGTLDQEKEDKLFLLLASNEELRNEFKNNFAIDKAFVTDAGALIPNTKSTMRVFSRLGITVPGALVSADVEPTSSIPKKGFWNKYSGNIYSFLVGSVITAIILILLWQFGELNTSNSFSDNKINNKEQKISNKDYDDKNSQNFKNNNNESLNNDNKISSKPIEQKPLIKYIIRYDTILVKTPESSNLLTENDVSSSSTNNNLYTPKLSYFSNKNIATNNLNLINDNKLIVRQFESKSYTPTINNFMKSQDLHNLGMSVEFYGNNFWKSKGEISPSENPIFNNSGLALKYNLFDNFALIGDIRQENFYQEYRGIESDNREFIYKQHPSLFSYGLGVRWTLLNFLNLNTFIQAVGGGNRAGWLARGMFGINWAPSYNYSIMIGVEGSTLNFHHMDKNFTSSKYGFLYGFSFNF